MQSHPCTKALEQGCLHLNIPTTAARELLRFLLVRRFNDADERMRQEEEQMSPSAILDKLWHWCLLETDVRDQVEALVGKLSHTTRTDSQEDAVKMARRLRTMEAMAAEGWFPDLQLWQEPGTMMHSITAVKTTIAGKQTEVTKYYCAPPDFAAGHTAGVQPAAGEAAAPVANLPQDPSADPATRPSTEPSDAPQEAPNSGAIKRKRFDSQSSASASDERMTIRVRLWDNSQLVYAILKSLPVGKLHRAVAAKKGIDAALFYLFNGEGTRMCWWSEQSLASYGIEDGDIIDCLMVQRGC